MRNLYLIILLLSIFLACNNSYAKTRVVANSNVDINCWNKADYTTIQAAIYSAKKKDVIEICAGVYSEQLTVNKNKITIKPFRENNVFGPVIIKPVDMISTASSLFTGNPIAPVILVNANNFKIKDIQVDGEHNNIATCQPLLVGIYFQNGSGKVKRMQISNFEPTSYISEDENCLSGIGILIQSTGGNQMQKVKIIESEILNYRKIGILANGENADVKIREKNIITGKGPDTVIQRGIETNFGAKGEILLRNIINNHSWSLCSDLTPDKCNEGVAIGILGFGEKISVKKKNEFHNNQVAFYVFGNKNVFENNIIETSGLDAIIIGGGEWGFKSNKNRIINNKITGTERTAIWLEGYKNKIKKNKIDRVRYGICEKFGEDNSIPTTGPNKNTFENVDQDGSSLGCPSAEQQVESVSFTMKNFQPLTIPSLP